MCMYNTVQYHPATHRKAQQINNDRDIPLDPGHPLMYREHYLTIINFVNKSLDVHRVSLSLF